MFNQSFKILFACLAAVATVNAGVSELDGRIVGGQVIPISSTPYLMQLRDSDDDHFCGGTLVGLRQVITAAHCLDDVDPTTITVVGGATTIHEHGVQSKVISAVVPKMYTSSVKHLDIAVLNLDTDMSGDNIQVIPLCTEPLKEGDELQISGWGKLSESGPYPDYLSTVFVPTISRDECVSAHNGVAKITSSMVCGSKPGIKDACTGDSGGPAVHNKKLCGVVSWGIGCGRVKYPGVYTGIAEAHDFLDYALSPKIE